MVPRLHTVSAQRRRLLAALGLSSLAGVLASACSPVALLNGAAPSDTYRRTSGIAYGELPRQRLDVYRPTASGADAPIVVFFYGGAWRHGARGDYLFVGEALAALGCVAVLADYRLFPEARFPAFVEDGAAALRWARDHAAEHGGNPRRLFVMGHSAGAHIALMLVTDERYLAAAGMQPRELAGAIGLAGPYDFLPFKSRRTAEIFDPPERWPRSQPINFVSGHEPPLLLMTGGDDDIVDPGNSTRLAAKARGLGGKVELIRYPGEGHRSIIAALAAPLRERYRVQADIAAFIARQGSAALDAAQV
ncbi:MAG: alpha/beta hydrolase [Sterolibacteriaceae bacterium]|jgi:acetyl esterase/lipase|uniref:Alpha/beta hydrolase n=1 Tax=Candidatus Methylophosphatis roskildensis TaxID=2899263 RepID=A0A9D7HLC5_9PROT|nr:alpha/beta hydrolase [Candidatus Methylophosphatis roskildensis]MBK7234587.1 alpha/beta hydrolase [Sterolibacteriaceae bacterium]